MKQRNDIPIAGSRPAQCPALRLVTRREKLFSRGTQPLQCCWLCTAAAGPGLERRRPRAPVHRPDGAWLATQAKVLHSTGERGEEALDALARGLEQAPEGGVPAGLLPPRA
eukprot:gene11046-biopygen7746